jgi:chromosome segregation ATPase
MGNCVSYPAEEQLEAAKLRCQAVTSDYAAQEKQLDVVKDELSATQDRVNDTAHENGTLRRRLEELGDDYAEVREKYQEFKAEVKRKDNELEGQNRVIASTAHERDEERGISDGLRSDIKELERRIRELEERNQEAIDRGEREKSRAEYELTRAKSEAAEELSNFKSTARNDIDQLTMRLRKAEKTNHDLHEEHSNTKARAAKEISNVREAGQAELNKQRAVAKTNTEQMNLRLQHLEERNHLLLEEAASAEAKTGEQLAAANAVAQAELTSVRSEVHSLEQKLLNLKNQNKELKDELSNARTDLAVANAQMRAPLPTLQAQMMPSTPPSSNGSFSSGSPYPQERDYSSHIRFSTSDKDVRVKREWYGGLMRIDIREFQADEISKKVSALFLRSYGFGCGY